MRFWNQLIGEAKGTVKTQIHLHNYPPYQIIKMVENKIVTRQEVIDSGVIESCFGSDLADYIYPRDLHHDEVTEILNKRYADKIRQDSGESP